MTKPTFIGSESKEINVQSFLLCLTRLAFLPSPLNCRPVLGIASPETQNNISLPLFS